MSISRRDALRNTPYFRFVLDRVNEELFPKDCAWTSPANTLLEKILLSSAQYEVPEVQVRKKYSDIFDISLLEHHARIFNTKVLAGKVIRGLSYVVLCSDNERLKRNSGEAYDQLERVRSGENYVIGKTYGEIAIALVASNKKVDSQKVNSGGDEGNPYDLLRIMRNYCLIGEGTVEFFEFHLNSIGLGPYAKFYSEGVRLYNLQAATGKKEKNKVLSIV